MLSAQTTMFAILPSELSCPMRGIVHVGFTPIPAAIVGVDALVNNFGALSSICGSPA
jgi:hypothetical protein